MFIKYLCRLKCQNLIQDDFADILSEISAKDKTFRQLNRLKPYILIRKLFSRSTDKTQKVKEVASVSWTPLTSSVELESILKKSQEKLQVIFKHSSRCGISNMVLRRFNQENAPLNTKIDFHFLDIFVHREVSNEIANKFHVIHESPQMILLKNGVVVYDCSHSDINHCELSSYLD